MNQINCFLPLRGTAVEMVALIASLSCDPQFAAVDSFELENLAIHIRFSPLHDSSGSCSEHPSRLLFESRDPKFKLKKIKIRKFLQKNNRGQVKIKIKTSLASFDSCFSLFLFEVPFEIVF